MSEAAPDCAAEIRRQISENPIILYMKGSPVQPQCGFSMRAVQVLGECGHRYAYVDILSHPQIRSTLPSVSDWPTFPQLFIAGELIGGSDIIAEMHTAGELEPLLASAVAGAGAESPGDGGDGG